MVKELVIAVDPQVASDEKYYLPVVARQLGVGKEQITFCQLKNRSIDARHGRVKISLRMDVYINQQPEKPQPIDFRYQNVEHKTPVVIVGAGPGGLFAALRFLQLGYKPIIIERGKDVHSRRFDVAQIHRNEGVDPNSNYGFGEGGAGTYSDGKLFTRSKKRGDISFVLQVLNANGAKPDILVDTHPHIGTDKLPGIIENIRKTIVEYGGEVHFNTQFAKLMLNGDKVCGVELTNGTKIESKAVILATGHSARDVYQSLYNQGVELQAKSFAMGVRIEHPQALIDSIQYSCKTRSQYLPAAAYSLVHQVDGRGVYSFCMCPGGIIVPASTSPNEMVVNGMSPSTRGTRWANSGLVVEIRAEDLMQSPNDILAGLRYQMNYEQLSFASGGGGQIAPAQRVTDFVEGKISSSLPESSFRPGIASSAMHQWMPAEIGKRLQQGLLAFDRKMHGFYTSEATLIGVESRTSSPIRIPRDKDTLQHIQIAGLFPCGEGAGYAGGIVSSALDGQRCAESAAEYLK
ncbi:MAG: FAD-binding protein [Salinivirgaceae bacterium]|nr:FAD-binding protein [Salinivirgaceae bacterium]